MSTMRHTYLQFVYTIHILFSAVFLYIGIQYFRGTKINPFWYSVLLLFGFGALGYHVYWLINSLYTSH